jgi:MYXO-CTERM domain-containing protein
MRIATMVGLLALPATADAAAPTYVRNPFAAPADGPVRIDVAAGTRDGVPTDLVESQPTSAIDFADLDAHRRDGLPPANAGSRRAALPEGFVQRGGVIVPEAVTHGALMVGDPDRARELALSDRPRTHAIPADACSFPDEVPPGIYEGDSRRGGEFPRRGTIYLNFTGGMLSTGGENSAENLSGIALTNHMYPAFGGGQALAVAVAQAVAQDFDRWGIRVVYDPRPRKLLPYTMAMVGGHHSDTTAGPSLGVASIDCEDFGQRNVCYSFTNNEPATAQANVVSQEVAHTYGLEHTYGGDRIMSYEGSGDKVFGDNCQQTFALQGQGNGCQGVNKCHCGIGDLQDDVLTIGMIYAPYDAPDVTPPDITLTSPADGSVFAVGEEIVVGFEVDDDFGGYGWKLVIEDEAGEVLVDQADYDRALTFDIVGLPAGTYTFTGEIEDHADHITTHSITVVVEGDGASDETGADASGDGSGDGAGEDDGDGDGDGDGGDADASGGSSGSGSDGAGQGPAADEGCQCRASTTGGPRGLVWLAVVAAIGRRRRAAGPDDARRIR